MAEVVGALFTSHSPLCCFSPPEAWADARERRRLRDDVPFDSAADNLAKGRRIREGFSRLAGRVEELRPDGIVIFGDDQLESFDFSNFPTMSIYVGEEADGSASLPNGEGRYERQRYRLHGHPVLAAHLLRELIASGFDPAFSISSAEGRDAVGHAFVPPLAALSALEIPIVPIQLNCYYAPQITGARSYQIGKALHKILAAWKSKERILVIGSGGLWHTPMMEAAYLDETFDREVLRLISSGEAAVLAEFFDAYAPPDGDASQASRPLGRGTTGIFGMPGPQGGTREVCNWISASAAVEGRPAAVVDYIPVYASPAGIAFAFSE